MAAFVSAMLVFVGSAFLLLALILGPKLAYFVTASITLAFTLIMGVVWSINPLGPLGEAPEWVPIGANEDAAAIEFDAETARRVAATGGALVADLAARAGGGTGERRDRGGVIVGLDLEQDVDRLGVQIGRAHV